MFIKRFMIINVSEFASFWVFLLMKGLLGANN